MKYSIKVNEVKSKEGNIKGFATVVLGDSFKITNIAILYNAEMDQLFVSMPRYKSNERSESGEAIYKDICNPITKEFRQELYENILKAFGTIADQEPTSMYSENTTIEMPEFTVTVTPFEKEDSNIRGLARVYFADEFIVNNVNIIQGKENIFAAMPSYKTKQKDENGKPVYQDVCYPITRAFREKLFGEIINVYEKEVEKKKEKIMSTEQEEEQKKEQKEDGFQHVSRQDTPFR